MGDTDRRYVIQRQREQEARERAKAEQARLAAINPGANSLGITDWQQWNKENLFGMTPDEVMASGYYRRPTGTRQWENQPETRGDMGRSALEQAAQTYRYNTNPNFQNYIQRQRRDAPNFLEGAWDGLTGAAENVFGAAENIAGPALATAGLAYGGNALINALGGGAATAATPSAGFATPGASTVGAVPAGGYGALAGTGGIRPPTSSNSLNTAGESMNWLDTGLNVLGGLGSAYLTNEYTGNAMDEIGRQYDQTRADFAPWREAGVNALSKLENFDNETVLNDPMYQLALDESLKAVNRGNAARGFNLSGNALIDEARTAAAMSGDFGRNAWNRQAGLAGVGQTATGATANAGQNAAGAMADLNIMRGQGYNNALQGGLQNYFLQNYLGR